MLRFVLGLGLGILIGAFATIALRDGGGASGDAPERSRPRPDGEPVLQGRADADQASAQVATPTAPVRPTRDAVPERQPPPKAERSHAQILNALESTLEEPGPVRGKVVQDLLGEFAVSGGTRLPSDVVRGIRERTPGLRSETLALWPVADVRAELENSLTEPDDDPRWWPLVLITELEERGQVSRRLVLRLLEHDLPEARVAGIRGTQGLPQPPLSRVVALALHDTSADVRQWAVDVLGEFVHDGIATADEVAPAVEAALRDPTEQVRAAGTDALACLGAAAYELMVALLRDQEFGASVEYVRPVIEAAADRLNDPEDANVAPWRSFLEYAAREADHETLRGLAQRRLTQAER